MKGSVDTHLGNVFVDNNVIAEYAGNVALECYGVVGMASINLNEGVTSILKRDSMAKGITISLKYPTPSQLLTIVAYIKFVVLFCPN